MNPFVITGRIEPQYFCDRVAETERIVRELTNGGNICLISQRRMGKSKLVKHCYEQPEIANRYYTFYIDILHTGSLRELTYAFGSAVFNTLRGRSRKMLTQFAQALKSINARFGFDALSGTPTFSLELGDIEQPEYTLSEIFSCLEKADKPCIVAFDEFQQVAAYEEHNTEALLRSHIQHLGNVHCIFSGSERHMLTEMFVDSARPFYNSSAIMELKPIACEVYTDFVEHWMAQGGRTIERADVERVYSGMQGNTYYMQKVFHGLYAITSEGDNCTMALIGSVVDGMMEEAATNYRLQLSRMTEKQKELLYAIATEGRAERITGSAFIKRYALASASSVQTAMKKLLEYGIVGNDGGVYTVSDVLFHKYLLRMRDAQAEVM